MKALTLKAIACATLFAAGLATMPAQAASPAPASTAVQAETAQTPLVQVGHKHSKHRKWRRHGGGVTLYFGAPAPRRGYVARCTAGRAVHKASRIGVRHARVVWSNHRIIKVRGRKHGHRVTVNFGRAPSCPIYSSY